MDPKDFKKTVLRLNTKTADMSTLLKISLSREDVLLLIW